MKSDLLMDFSVDKQNNQIKVKREFDAAVTDVWAAYTQAELLDQWWAPKPWKAETKSMDFREGGRWFYAMVSPQGERHWSVVDYITINPQRRFKAVDAFSDEHGVLSTDFPQAKWEIRFEAEGETTMVHIEVNYEKLEDLETIIKMGFKEGFTMALENLDELLSNR